MSYISLMKYYTFNATVDDLGINNEVLWLLVHGGITNFNASGFGSVYPIQYEKPIIFLVAGLYYFFPSINFLLILQSFVIGVAAVPLYFLGKRIIGSAAISAFISISYLFFFPLASANLFDFHFMIFTPLAYFLMVLSWINNKKILTIISAVFLASINPLTLLMAVFFLIWILIKELFKMVEDKYFNVKKYLKKCASIIIIAIFLVLLLYLYQYIGNLYLSSYAGHGSGKSIFNGIYSTLFFAINAKLEMFIYLFASVAFIALLDLSTVFLAFPYIAYIFYTTGSANFDIFGLMYPIMSAGPIYFGVILVIGRIRIKERETDQEITNLPAEKTRSARSVNFIRNLQKLYAKQTTRMLIALGVCTLLFGVVYSPISPINSDVTGGYFAGNHNTYNLIRYTSEDQFLWKMIKLVPENASIITENDFPQLTGREHFETGSAHSASWEYNYMFTSLSFNNFENQGAFINLMNRNLNSGAFGVYAEGMGGILLKRDYHDLPVLFKPTDFNLTPSSLSLGPYASANGSTIIDSKAAYDFWYGPYITLLPGNYSATFYLSSSNISSTHNRLLSLDVAVGPNSTILNATSVYSNMFTSSGNVVAISFNFTSNIITSDLQLRGMFPSGLSQLTLYNISLKQIS